MFPRDAGTDRRDACSTLAEGLPNFTVFYRWLVFLIRKPNATATDHLVCRVLLSGSPGVSPHQMEFNFQHLTPALSPIRRGEGED